MKSLSLDRLLHVYSDMPTPDHERYLRLIPLIGPAIANFLLSIRIRPIIQRVEQELIRRRRPSLEEWGDDIDKAIFAQSICEVAMLEMGWPNDHFLPTDPVAIVFWNHRDNLDFAAALADIETNLDIKINVNNIQEWNEKQLGDVIDDLWRRQNRGGLP